MKDTFKAYFATIISTLKFHLLDHILEYLETFGSLNISIVSPPEQCNVHIKNAHQYRSQKHPSWMEQAVTKLLKIISDMVSQTLF